MAEMGFTKKETRMLEKQRFNNRRLVVDNINWSWYLTVVTTSRFVKIPRNIV